MSNIEDLTNEEFTIMEVDNIHSDKTNKIIRSFRFNFFYSIILFTASVLFMVKKLIIWF